MKFRAAAEHHSSSASRKDAIVHGVHNVLLTAEVKCSSTPSVMPQEALFFLPAVAARQFLSNDNKRTFILSPGPVSEKLTVPALATHGPPVAPPPFRPAALLLVWA
jgi:hypothetical protein